ncbi:MAG: hypothetical protein ACFBRM_05050, partial [Pikeienuella sp.]
IDFVPDPSGASEAERIEIEWPTALTSRVVDAGDLTDLTFRVFDGTTLVFEDPAVLGGAAQSLGGVPREIETDIQFEFDLDLSATDPMIGVNRIANDVNARASLSTSELVYNIFGSDNTNDGNLLISVARFQGGSFLDETFANTATVQTVENRAVVPLPAGLPLALTGLAALGLLARRLA